MRMLARLLLIGLALSPGLASAQTAPLVDHHQHLMSPAAAATVNDLPELAEPLPPVIADLLARRAAAWRDPERLAALYLPQSSALDVFDRRFIRGGGPIAEFFTNLFTAGYALHPIAAGIDGDRASIYSYYLELDDPTAAPIAHQLLELERDVDGAWLIAREDLVYPGPPIEEPIDAANLVGQLDAAGIKRAVVLSVAYWFAEPQFAENAETLASVQAENDWTIAQAARFPDRLIPFCSVNPLRDHALAEIERCQAAGGRGLKMHFGNSDVFLADEGVTERVRPIFAAANRLGLPIVVHTRDRDSFGERESRILLDALIPAAPDVVVQVAHLWGGSTYSAGSLAAFARAFEEEHPSTRNLYFDLTDVGINAGGDEQAREVVGHMRTIGLDRMLYGSDAPIGGHGDAAWSWAQLREGLPLAEDELRRIAANVAPYLAN